MRTIEKQRIYKRFMAGESILKIAYSIKHKDRNWYGKNFTAFKLSNLIREIEQIIRDCIKTTITFHESRAK